MNTNSTDFACLVTGFLTDYLPHHRCYSKNTVLSYRDTLKLFLRFLKEEKVALVPGTAFGDCGEGYLRISYAYSLDNLKLALSRLERFVEKLRAEKMASR